MWATGGSSYGKNVPITVSGSVIRKTDYYFSYICLKLIKINQKINKMSQILAWRIQILDRVIGVGHIVCRFILLWPFEILSGDHSRNQYCDMRVVSKDLCSFFPNNTWWRLNINQSTVLVGYNTSNSIGEDDSWGWDNYHGKNYTAEIPYQNRPITKSLQLGLCWIKGLVTNTF